MPIRPELRHFYRGPAWRAARERILARAGNRCEQCGKPDRETVETITGYSLNDPVMYWRATSCGWRNWLGGRAPAIVAASLRAGIGKKPRVIRVVLAVCHLNHMPGEDDDDNLRAWCQWCHLHHDQVKHRETRAIRKDLSRPIQWEGALSL